MKLEIGRQKLGAQFLFEKKQRKRGRQKNLFCGHQDYMNN